MVKKILLSGAIFGLLSVLIGAFGSHALEEILKSNERVETFDIAVKYQMFHVVALMIAGILAIKKPTKLLSWSALLFISGILLFSGSLYILSILNIPKLGMITPIGGLCFIAGWMLLCWHIIRETY